MDTRLSQINRTRVTQRFTAHVHCKLCNARDTLDTTLYITCALRTVHHADEHDALVSTLWLKPWSAHNTYDPRR